MKKPILLILLLLAACCSLVAACALVIALIPESSEPTEPAVYMSTEYYTTLNEKVNDYYELKTTVDPTTSNKSTIDAMVTQARAKLDDIDSYQKPKDKVLGTGVDDLNSSIDLWITTERTQLDRLSQIAQIVGEDGKTDTLTEVNQANALIKQINDTSATNTELMNKAFSDYYNQNYGN